MTFWSGGTYWSVFQFFQKIQILCKRLKCQNVAWPLGTGHSDPLETFWSETIASFRINQNFFLFMIPYNLRAIKSIVHVAEALRTHSLWAVRILDKHHVKWVTFSPLRFNDNIGPYASPGSFFLSKPPLI